MSDFLFDFGDEVDKVLQVEEKKPLPVEQKNPLKKLDLKKVYKKFYAVDFVDCLECGCHFPVVLTLDYDCPVCGEMWTLCKFLISTVEEFGK